MATPHPTRKSRLSISAMVLVLLGAGLVAATVAPVASAHTCQSSDPAANCGSCPSGNHSHTDNSGNVYCSSSEPGSSEPECGTGGLAEILACLKALLVELRLAP